MIMNGKIRHVSGFYFSFTTLYLHTPTSLMLLSPIWKSACIQNQHSLSHGSAPFRGVNAGQLCRGNMFFSICGTGYTVISKRLDSSFLVTSRLLLPDTLFLTIVLRRLYEFLGFFEAFAQNLSEIAQFFLFNRILHRWECCDIIESAYF